VHKVRIEDSKHSQRLLQKKTSTNTIIGERIQTHRLRQVVGTDPYAGERRILQSHVREDEVVLPHAVDRHEVAAILATVVTRLGPRHLVCEVLVVAWSCYTIVTDCCV